MSNDTKSVCALCGEPMPANEEMFTYHGYSGPCPGPRKAKRRVLTPLEAELLKTLEAAAGYLQNASIDLQTGTPKRTAIEAIAGGLRVVNAAIAKAKGDS